MILLILPLSYINFHQDILAAFSHQKYHFTPRRAEQRLPDVIIPGVKKCGTGALIEMLKLHPNIVAPDYVSTENDLFDDAHWAKGIERFIKKMARGFPEQLIVTKSQSLIRFPNSDAINTKLKECQADINSYFNDLVNVEGPSQGF